MWHRCTQGLFIGNNIRFGWYQRYQELQYLFRWSTGTERLDNRKRLSESSYRINWNLLDSNIHGLEGKLETIVANPQQIKYIPGRKNDILDSEWIAEVCLNGQIKSSYVPHREIRDIRELTRTHVKLTQTKTAFKNRIHKILQRAGIRISGVLADIFGKSGIIILNGLLNGNTLDKIFKDIKNKQIKKKKNEVKEAIKGELSQADIFVINECLDAIRFLDDKIEATKSRIFQSLTGLQKDMEIRYCPEIDRIIFTG